MSTTSYPHGNLVPPYARGNVSPRVTKYPISIWRMTISILPSPIGLAHIPCRCLISISDHILSLWKHLSHSLTRPCLLRTHLADFMMGLRLSAAAFFTFLGGALQVEPMKSTLKPPPGCRRLKQELVKLLSNFAFSFNLRRYIRVCCCSL